MRRSAGWRAYHGSAKMLLRYTHTFVAGLAAVVISTCLASRSSQSIGDFFAQPSDAPRPFQFDQLCATDRQSSSQSARASQPDRKPDTQPDSQSGSQADRGLQRLMESGRVGGGETVWYRAAVDRDSLEVDDTPSLRGRWIRRAGAVAPASPHPASRSAAATAAGSLACAGSEAM